MGLEPRSTVCHTRTLVPEYLYITFSSFVTTSSVDVNRKSPEVQTINKLLAADASLIIFIS